MSDTSQPGSSAAMRNVLVTGASTGIGRATALRLDEAGWRVFATVRREADARALREQASERLVPLQLDVTDTAAVAEALAALEARVGDDGLQGLVNNAGIAVPGPLELQPIEDFRRQLEVNLVAPLAITQRLLEAIRRGDGRIVNIGSMGGYAVDYFVGAYSASKYGIEAISDALRRELRPWRIPVVVVQPGAIATEIWQRGRREGERLLAGMTPRGRALYASMAERVIADVERTARRGIAPERCARVIERALTVARPRTRYRVGIDARLAWHLTRWLPDRAIDAALARLHGVRDARATHE